MFRNVLRSALNMFKIAVYIAGALFIAVLAHEGVHLIQLAANSSVAEPTALVINLAPSTQNTSFAQVNWTWKDGVTQQQALAFGASLWGWELLAYIVFFAVFVLAIWVMRKGKR